jgi:hypothetical protein
MRGSPGVRTGEVGQRLDVGGALDLGNAAGDQGGVDAGMVTEGLDDRHQELRLQERELPVAEVVDQRAEGLGPQGHRSGLLPRPGRVERERCGHHGTGLAQ